MLTFASPGLEHAFQRRRNLHLMYQDASWAVLWMVFGSSVSRKRFSKPSTWQENVALLFYMAWSPLLLFLVQYRREWYLKHRHAFLVAMRVSRLAAVIFGESGYEAAWVGSSSGVPSTPLAIYIHLCWRVNSLLFTAMGCVVPLRLFLPLHLAIGLLHLHSAAVRCQLDCGSSSFGSSGSDSSSNGLVSAAATAAVTAAADSGASACTGGGLEAVALGQGGSCAAAGGAAVHLLAERYYGRIAGWIRGCMPLSGSVLRLPGTLLPGRWQLQHGGCLAKCYAVHGWLQMVGGVLLPVLLLWGIEERQRLRELTLWQQQQQQQQHHWQEQQLQAVGQQAAAQPGLTDCHAVGPLSALYLLGWLASSAWLLWLLLEAVLL